MNAIWISTVGAIGTLLGAVLGGLLVNFGSKRQFQRQQNWQRNQFVQERLADIAELAENVRLGCAKLYGNSILTVEGSPDLRSDPPSIPLPRLKTLLDFYAPELDNYFQVMIQIRDVAGDDVAQAITGAPFNKDQRQQLNLRLLRNTEKMNKACEALATAAAQIARQRLGLENPARK